MANLNMLQQPLACNRLRVVCDDLRQYWHRSGAIGNLQSASGLIDRQNFYNKISVIWRLRQFRRKDQIF